MGSEFFLQKISKKQNSKKQIFINLREIYWKKNPTKNEKEFEREREITFFVWEKYAWNGRE